MTSQSTKPAARLNSLYHHVTYRPFYDSLFIFLLIFWECILCGIVIQYVSYTEIDFSTYMEQVSVYLHGERDYIHIRGATGPCVYPAGYLYLYSLIQSWTDNGTNIRRAQYIFAFFYVVSQALVLYIYHATLIRTIRSQIASNDQKDGKSVPTKNDATSKKRRLGYFLWCCRFMMVLLCCSKRVHSIYVLRLFNDGPTMLFLYASIVCFIHNYWNIGCILFSLGVSIKMNVLLFAPGLLLLLLQVSNNLYHVIFRLFVCCGLPQLILGGPFLLHHPLHYLRKAFELDRSFFYQWTVNWKFLPEDIFLSKPLSMSLLLLHIWTLVYFCIIWFQSISVGNTTAGRRLFLFSPLTTKELSGSKHQQLSPMYITSTLLTSNFIGICFSRTIHYQFYSWYFHALPFLLICPRIHSSLQPTQSMTPWWMVRAIVILIAVEIAYLTFPATPVSSAMLQIAHFAILIQIGPPEMVLAETSPSNNKLD